MGTSITTTSIRRAARWSAPLVFGLAVLACGDNPAKVEAGTPAAPPAVSAHRSADAIERSALARVSAHRSADALEREARASADALEREARASAARYSRESATTATNAIGSADALERQALAESQG